ncbi:alpha/beta hydrolase [Chelatococcus reniformis]|uniref:Alpha/beta hydrolase n=1 Tax=Chelatococcus reniformis TaxID=1494448 RepID=A0A916X6U8_9HYPH|nr:alpha/beta hydrolase [Chelatococcus reniformis]GGC48100.1 alpha/beta hydrolase [Chelatococcus reniformis]
MTNHPARTVTAPAIVAEDLMIPSDTAGIALHLRRKHLAAVSAFPAERTVLLMHGATYASESLFDVPLGGTSFMDHLAAAGYDVYAVDVRGYGGSTRPPQMAAPPVDHPPLVRTETGVRDLASAVAFILDRQGLARLNLVGMSWGGSVAGAFASQNSDRVGKLALVAPLWVNPHPMAVDPGGQLGAYRKVAVDGFRQRWLGAAPDDKRGGLIPPGGFEAFASAALASDPQGREEAPPTMRAVNGPLQDIREAWSVGRALYRPEAITVPVLLVHAEWDADVPLDVARAFFGTLAGAPYRRWVEIGEGTHMVLLEKNRWQAFDAIHAFLEEPGVQAA